MLCEICHKNTATVKVTQIINTIKKEINLCKACAEKQGLTNPLASFPELFGGLLEGLLNENQIGVPQKISSKAKCSECGLTFDEFQKTGLFGCGQCYDSFIEEVKVLLRRIHGSNKHIGDRPICKRVYMHHPNLEKLKSDLKRAVEHEQFEKAADIRDMIRDVERQMKVS